MGTVIWRLKLAQGEKRDLPFAFSIRFPKDVVLQDF
jgi:hypothetical protein